MGFRSLDIKLPTQVDLFLWVLEEAGFTAGVAGGAVRDLIRGDTPHDWDIATSATPAEVINVFNGKVGCKAFATDKEASFGRCTVITTAGAEFEVTTFRNESVYSDKRRPDAVEFVGSMEMDSARRDFTMNSMFLDKNGVLYDYMNGYADAVNGIVEFIGNAEERITEDPLRLLRYLRFDMRYSFCLSWGVINLFNTHVEQLDLVAVERVKIEIEKMFTEDAERFYTYLFRTDLFSFLFGHDLFVEVKNCFQITKWHPEVRLTTHMELVAENLMKMEVKDSSLYWIALLHDLGKPFTKSVLENGNTSFHGHELKSVEIAHEFMDRFKFSSKEKEKIIFIIANHMRIANVKSMKKAKMKKFIAPKYIEDLCVFHDADDMLCDVSEDSIYIREMLKKYKDEIKPFVNGSHLIERGMEPGAHFGGILKGMYNIQLENDLTSVKEIMDMYFNGGKK